MGLDPVKESSILNQRHLYGLGYARHPFAVAQREQEKVVVENRYRWTERSQKVFLTPIIDTILHAHTRVVLGKNSRRHTEVANTAVGNRRSVSHSIEHGTTTDGHDIRMPVDAVQVYQLDDTVNTFPVVLDGLTPRHLQDVAHQSHSGNGSEVVMYSLDECRMAGSNAFINHYQ